MYYEINVSLNGSHLFATHKRSIQSEDELVLCWKIFEERFPEAEGYKLSATFWQHTGKQYTPEELTALKAKY